MRVLVFEASYRGHFYNYVRHLVTALLEITPDITLCISQEGRQSPQYAELLAPLAPRVTLDFSANVELKANLGSAKARARALVAAVRKHKPDRVYVPSADGLAQVVGMWGMLGKHPLAGIPVESAFHRAAFAYPAMNMKSRLTSAFSYQTLKRLQWERLFQVDWIGYDWIKARGGPFAERTWLMPDPIESIPVMDRRVARAALDIPPEAPVIGCVGAMDTRKGIDLLLKAFMQFSAARPAGVSDEQPRLLLVGQQNETVRQILKGACSDLVCKRQVIARDSFVEFPEMDRALAAMDVVAILNPNHLGIASILLRGAAAGRPVLANSYGWMGQMTTRFHLGWTCDPLDSGSLVRGIQQSLEEAAAFRFSPSREKLLAFHSPENMHAVFTDGLRKAMGLPPSPALVPWESVAQ